MLSFVTTRPPLPSLACLRHRARRALCTPPPLPPRAARRMPSCAPSVLTPAAQQQQPRTDAPPAPPPPSGQVRVRQHVNPLARRWSQPLHLPPAWFATAFADASLPLVVDVGVAKGRFLLRLAQAAPQANYLGIEIREPLVHQANRVAAENDLNNLFYVACNANVSLADLLANAPPGALQSVLLQFCDPWFKKRHAKRRMVNASLVDAVHTAFADAARHCPARVRDVFLQSDVLAVAEEMRALFDAHPAFERFAVDAATDTADVDSAAEDGWLPHNPLAVRTEREIAVLNKHGTVYRARFRHVVPSAGQAVVPSPSSASSSPPRSPPRD